MKKQKVLIVDDDSAITWTITTALQRRRPDLQIFQAMSGQEAYGYIRQLKELDVLITDIHMPKLSGIDLLEKLQQQKIDTSIIVITGYGTDETHNQVEELGAVKYFTKPFDLNVLADAVIALLDQRRERKSHPGFSGHFGNLKMVDVIQINCLLQKTGLLKIRAGTKTFKVYFDGGNIIHAEGPNRYGEESIYDIIGMGAGEFEFIDDASPVEQTISKDWEYLLIEHCRRKDQSKDAS